MSAKAQVKAVRRRMLESLYGQPLRALQARIASSGSPVRERAVLDAAQLVHGDIDRLGQLFDQWRFDSRAPGNLSFNGYVRYVLRKEAAAARKTNRPYGRQA